MYTVVLFIVIFASSSFSELLKCAAFVFVCDFIGTLNPLCVGFQLYLMVMEKTNVYSALMNECRAHLVAVSGVPQPVYKSQDSPKMETAHK